VQSRFGIPHDALSSVETYIKVITAAIGALRALGFLSTKPVTVSLFALRTKPNLEKVTTRVLQCKGIEAFLPVCRVRRRWSDRIKELDVPLFPGLTFCKFEPNHCAPVLSTPGAVSFVEFGSKSAAIEDAEIVAIKRIAASRLPAHESPFVRVGHRVLLDGGPLAGLEGIVLNLRRRIRTSDLFTPEARAPRAAFVFSGIC
jgi:transcription antitermination factor NusG